MANEQYMNWLREILEETGKYGSIYPDGDGYNDEVFLFEGYGDDIKTLNELCKAKLKANGVDTYPDYDRDDYYIDFITGDNWGWYDSYYVCDECGKAYNNDDHYYWCGDGFIFCWECTRENHKEEYVDDLTNDYTRANTLLKAKDLEELGFEKMNEGEYEHGMYGTMQHPKDVYDLFYKAYPNSDIIFHIADSNPFAVYYDCYVRKSEEDEEREVYYNKYTKDVYTMEEMKTYCKENHDYGDPTNALTYCTTWWQECGFRQIA